MFQQYFHNGRRKMQQRNLLLFLQFEQLARRCLNPQNEQHRPRFVQVYFLCYGMAKYPKSVTKVICKASSQIANKYRTAMKIYHSWTLTYLEYSVYFNMQKFFRLNYPFATIFLIITLARVFCCFAVWNCIRIRVILIRAVAFRLGCFFLCRWLLRFGSGWHLFY